MKKNSSAFMYEGNDAIKYIRDASFLFTEYVANELELIGMRTSYCNIMYPLIGNDGMTQLELVRSTHLKAPTISITLRNMERDGLIRREKSDSDRRETHVYITDKGREMHKKVLDTFGKASDVMLKGLTEKELASVCRSMEKIAANFQKELGDDRSE